MTYETKNITFHVIRVKVSIKSRSSRTLPMNLHSCATLESCDGKRSWDQDSHGLNCDDEYDTFNESHEQKKKLGRDETFRFKRDDGDYDDSNDTHDLGLDDSKGECIIDGESSSMRRMRVMMIKSCALSVDMVMIRIMMRVRVTKRNCVF